MQTGIDNKVQVILSIFAEKDTQRDFESTIGKDHVCGKLANMLAELNAQHILKQICVNLKILKQNNQKLNDHNSLSGSDRRAPPHTSAALFELIPQSGGNINHTDYCDGFLNLEKKTLFIELPPGLQF